MLLPDFASAIKVLENGTGKTMTDDKIEVWYQCLHDLPLAALQAAITRYLCEGDDWPSISKIRKLAGAAMHGECLLFGEAFGQMLSVIHLLGAYHELEARKELDDLTWRTVQALGGWVAVCDSPTDQRATFRAQFRMAYETQRDREEKHRALPEAVRPRIENRSQESVLKLSEQMKLPDAP